MTDDHLGALLTVAEAKKEKDGWFALPEGRHLTLYVAFNGASLSVARVMGMKREGGLLFARTVKGESFILALDDVYAGAVEAPPTGGRKAGFV
jgi:hypothetical protein